MQITQTRDLDFANIEKIVEANSQIGALFRDAAAKATFYHVAYRLDLGQRADNNAPFMSMTSDEPQRKTKIDLSLGEVKRIVAKGLATTEDLVTETVDNEAGPSRRVNGLRVTTISTQPVV